MFIKIIKLIGVVMLGVLALVVLALVSQGGIGRPVRYELLSNFRGWMRVKWEDPSCTTSRSRGLYLVIPISSDGVGCTSSEKSTLWTSHRAEVVYPDGRRARVPYIPVGYDPKSHVSVGFIGSEQEMEKSWSSMPQ